MNKNPISTVSNPTAFRSLAEEFNSTTVTNLPQNDSNPSVHTHTHAHVASNSKEDTTDTLANLLALGWVIVFIWCCCRRRPPGREHWRGEEIRRRYQELQARQRAKEERKQQTTQYRHQLVQHNMRTKVCARTP